jgi:Ca2+-binding RTX toxin-like protein
MKIRKPRRLKLESLERRELMAADMAWPIMDNFIPANEAPERAENNFVLAGDFDGNGLSDVAYINKANGENRTLLNHGNGQFVRRDSMFEIGAVNGMYDNNFAIAGDFNGDRVTDLAFIHKGHGGNRVLLSDGGRYTVRDGWLETGAINGMYDNNFVLAGDFDGNGFADIAFIHKGHGGNRTLQNLGDGRFTVRDGAFPTGAINGMYDNNLVVAGDFNGDGRADLLFVHKEHGGNRMVLSRGDWNFEVVDGSVPPGAVNGMFDQNFAVAGNFDQNPDAELLFINKSSGGNRMLGTIITGAWFGSNAAPWNWSNGVVTIKGTAERDVIRVTSTEYGTRFEVNGGWGLLPTSYASRIVVRAGAGHDYVKNDTGIPSTLYGGRDNDELDGGGAADHLFGEQGNDTLYGRNGNDTLSGGTGNDDLRGGNGNDKLLGGGGHDRLFGHAGIDFIYGEAGNDALFGDGSDRLSGGAGADRLLVRPGDYTRDVSSSDARIVFRDGTASWSIEEIARIDSVFAVLQNRTNNTALLKRADGGLVTFERVRRVSGSYSQSSYDNGVVQIADAAFRAESGLRHAVYRELAHNWDEPAENRFIASFRAISKWKEYNGGLIITASSDPRFRSVDGRWTYSQSATFAPFIVRTATGHRTEFGRNNPLDDFATCFQYIISGTASVPAAKGAVIRQFLDSITSPRFYS